MDWLKIFKIKILFLVLSFSPFCFSVDDADYENLVNLVKVGKFAKFKSSYDSGNLTATQKEDLIKTAKNVIEAEEKNWPKTLNGKGTGYWGDISTIKGRDIKKKINIHNVILCFIVTPCGGLMGWWLSHLIRNIDIFSRGLDILRNGNYPIPTGYTASQVGSGWESSRKTLFIKFIFSTFAFMCGAFVLGYGAARIMVKSVLLLYSYKRFKGATKIKILIETV